MNKETIKNTFNINKDFYNQIKKLIEEEKANSFTEFINDAIENYLKKIKQEEYEIKMKEACKDKEFIKRTMDSQNEFDCLDDNEDNKEW